MQLLTWLICHMEEDFLIEGKVGPIEIEALLAPIHFASFDSKNHAYIVLKKF